MFLCLFCSFLFSFLKLLKVILRNTNYITQNTNYISKQTSRNCSRETLAALKEEFLSLWWWNTPFDLLKVDVTTDIKAWKGSNWTIESHETSRCCRDKNSEHPDEQVKVELRGRSPLPLWAPASWLYETMTIITWNQTNFRLHPFNCFHLFIRHFEFLRRLPLCTVRYSMFLVSPSFFSSVTSFHDLSQHIYSNIKLNTFPILKSPWHNCSWEDKGDSLETIVVHETSTEQTVRDEICWCQWWTTRSCSGSGSDYSV